MSQRARALAAGRQQWIPSRQAGRLEPLKRRLALALAVALILRWRPRLLTRVLLVKREEEKYPSCCSCAAVARTEYDLAASSPRLSLVCNASFLSPMPEAASFRGAW